MPDKVLIIKLGALGDIVMSTPLVCAIKKQHLRSQIIILTAVQFGYIFENFDGISLKTFNRHSLYPNDRNREVDQVKQFFPYL